jgi:hypothetical protein
MIMEIALRDIRDTAKTFAGKPKKLVPFAAIYVALLGTAAVFVTTKEATATQVLVTLITLLAAPALFFLLQALCVNDTNSTGVVSMLKRAARDGWRLMIASIPVIFVAVLIYVLLGKAEAQFTSPLLAGVPNETAGTALVRIVFSTIRLLLFGIVMPLFCLHLWIEVTNDGARRVLGNIRMLIARALAPRSVVTYLMGLVLFGLVPYALIVLRTPVQRASIELTLLTIRLVLAAGFILLGWMITAGAVKKGVTEQA